MQRTLVDPMEQGIVSSADPQCDLSLEREAARKARQEYDSVLWLSVIGVICFASIGFFLIA